MNTPPTWSNSSIHDEIRESGLDCVSRPTPETDALRDLYENYEHRATAGGLWELCEFFQRERDRLAEETLKDCLHAMPCGYVPNHTVENLPAMIQNQTALFAEEISRGESLEEQLDKLTDACRNLIDAKGRHNTMIAFNKMKDVFQSLKTKEL
jgi:hypothetical protein